MEWLEWIVVALASCGASALTATVTPNSHRNGVLDAGCRLINLAAGNWGQSRNRY